MKPLLILPPAPARWPGLEALLADAPELWRDDARRRLCESLPQARDAFCVIPDGGHVLSAACVRRCDAAGVLGQIFTRPTHRHRGLARRVVETLLSWFDMTGGRRLYVSAPSAELAARLESLGFRRLHAEPDDGDGRVMLLRGEPLAVCPGPPGQVTVRTAQAGDFALLVELHQYLPGPDARVPLAQSACTAEQTTLELLRQHERGTCRVFVAFQGGRLVGAASVATEPLGSRTYAMVMPHDTAPAALREAAVEFARSRGYETVDFPLEAISAAGLPGAVPAR